MSTLDINEKEIIEYKRLKIIAELTPIREYVRLLENKHKCSFFDFEKQIKSDKENFNNWDDYIEWKAYQRKVEELNKNIGELDNAENIRLTK